MKEQKLHNKKALRALLKKNGHALLALPPYSPDFNPIEQSFGAMKRKRENMPLDTSVEALIMSYS